MILHPASDFDFAKARKAFRKQGMYIKHMPSGRIKVFLRPGYTINDIVNTVVMPLPTVKPSELFHRVKKE